MSEPVKITIPCEVCRDLAPLVQDGAASPGSEALVRAHLAACADCRTLFPDLAGAGECLPALPPPDDGRVLRAMRERINGLLLAFMLGGTLLGNVVMLSSRYAVLFLLIFPAVTGIAFWVDSRLWRLTPLLACVMAFMPEYLRRFAEAQGNFRLIKAFLHAVRFVWPLWVLLIVLCLLGALAAKLFKYAVKGEKPNETADR